MLPIKFGFIGQVVSEEIFRNQPIKNKNCLWQPCLLRNRAKMSNLYRGSSSLSTEGQQGGDYNIFTIIIINIHVFTRRLLYYFTRRVQLFLTVYRGSVGWGLQYIYHHQHQHPCSHQEVVELFYEESPALPHYLYLYHQNHLLQSLLTFCNKSQVLTNISKHHNIFFILLSIEFIFAKTCYSILFWQ